MGGPVENQNLTENESPFTKRLVMRNDIQNAILTTATKIQKLYNLCSFTLLLFLFIPHSPKTSQRWVFVAFHLYKTAFDVMLDRLSVYG